MVANTYFELKGPKIEESYVNPTVALKLFVVFVTFLGREQNRFIVQQILKS